MPVSRETPRFDDPQGDRRRSLLRTLIPHCSDSQIDKLTLFANEILRENEILHLISQRDPESEVVKQIADSSEVAGVISFRPGCKLLDVGSGAGLPGIVLKIIFPDIELTTLDSSPKKIAFQKKVCSILATNARFIHGDFRRISTGGAMDVVVVKAVGSHRDIMRKAGTWLGPSGLLIFMEGRMPSPAIRSSIGMIASFSHVTFAPYQLTEFGSSRHLAIVYKK